MLKTHSTEQIAENIKRQFPLPRSGSPLINFSGGFHFLLFILVTVVVVFVHCFFFAFLLFTLFFLLTLFVLFRPTFSVLCCEGKQSRMLTSILQLNTRLCDYIFRDCVTKTLVATLVDFSFEIFFGPPHGRRKKIVIKY